MVERSDIYSPNKHEFTAINPTEELRGILSWQYAGIFYDKNSTDPIEDFVALLNDSTHPERRVYVDPIEAELFRE